MMDRNFSASGNYSWSDPSNLQRNPSPPASDWSRPSQPYSDEPSRPSLSPMPGIGSDSYSASLPSPEEVYNTLDEPVSETIMRDLRNIGSKLKVVLLPRNDYVDADDGLCGLLFQKLKTAAQNVEDGKILKKKKKRKKKGKKYDKAAGGEDIPDDLELSEMDEKEENGADGREGQGVQEIKKEDEGKTEGSEEEEEEEEETEIEAAARKEEEERQKKIKERERTLKAEEWETERRRALREWDLWGPLLVCLSLGILLSINSPHSQSALTFSTVFVMMWCGSAVVAFNAILLGGNISFFQAACVLGYCVFPLNVAAMVVVVLRDLRVLKKYVWVYKIPIVIVAFMWCTRASTVFVGQFIKAERRALAVFPVFFFYAFLAWLIVLI
mmetsp:Transcript_7390/g.15995  ORF Transcript_7390/g.15995 Transcript_7390/m.15995 type:complete len:384 (-) Transcript_7390:281-1432(-)